MRFRHLHLMLIILLFGGFAFGTAPRVSSTNPTSGPTGTQFQIVGSGFGASQGTSTVTLAGRTQSVVNWSDTLITAVVSSDAATGPVSVTVAGVSSNATIYFNIPGPQITSISPSTGGVGTQVTVSGSGFQAVKGSGSSFVSPKTSPSIVFGVGFTGTSPLIQPFMNAKRKKIILGVLGIVIGLPMALIATLVAWMYISDSTNGTVVSSRLTRRYLLYVPKIYDPSKPTPLVISLHPAASWPAAEMNITRWNDLADERGFIVVYPAGSGAFERGSGQGPQIWRTGPRSQALDIKFFSDLIDKLEAEYNVDPARIYINGFSQGGGMAFVLSCRLSDRIAAIGAVAAAEEQPFSSCGDAGPMPMMAFHGTDDLVPYKGGPSPDPFNPLIFPDVRAWTASWARRNRCKGNPIEAPVTARVRRLAYTNCAKNADVVLYTVEGGGHTWPGGEDLPERLLGVTTHEINATRLLWEFYVQHPRGPK